MCIIVTLSSTGNAARHCQHKPQPNTPKSVCIAAAQSGRRHARFHIMQENSYMKKKEKKKKKRKKKNHPKKNNPCGRECQRREGVTPLAPTSIIVGKSTIPYISTYRKWHQRLTAPRNITTPSVSRAINQRENTKNVDSFFPARQYCSK